ncbi:hypothetical protein V6N11_036345 [Hibiscus sabdariffa]|uniref:Uncharacterized protein n=1 Tax=Hibiscus sabdariffa TaxID=183260 RepID=A0ABR2RA54_9ROSI
MGEADLPGVRSAKIKAVRVPIKNKWLSDLVGEGLVNPFIITVMKSPNYGAFTLVSFVNIPVLVADAVFAGLRRLVLPSPAANSDSWIQRAIPGLHFRVSFTGKYDQRQNTKHMVMNCNS